MISTSGKNTEGVRMITVNANADSSKFIQPPPGLEDYLLKVGDTTDSQSTVYSPRTPATASLESLEEMGSGPEEGSDDGGSSLGLPMDYQQLGPGLPADYQQLGQQYNALDISLGYPDVMNLLKEHVPYPTSLDEAVKTDMFCPPKGELVEPDGESTTFLIQGIPWTCTAKQFREELARQGLDDAFDYLRLPCNAETGVHMGVAVINVVDSSFAQALRCALFISFPECGMVPSQVQGFQACQVFWGPSMNLANIKSSRRTEFSVSDAPQVKQQFHKTKMCSFFMKGKCARGEQCGFAHSSVEVQNNPDLTKTRLCNNFMRGKCFDENCKYAHGPDELRSTQGVYKTVLCRWSTMGHCRLGSSCRHAHSIEEMRQHAQF